METLLIIYIIGVLVTFCFGLTASVIYNSSSDYNPIPDLIISFMWPACVLCLLFLVLFRVVKLIRRHKWK